jgi:hypothetical protein
VGFAVGKGKANCLLILVCGLLVYLINEGIGGKLVTMGISGDT